MFLKPDKIEQKLGLTLKEKIIPLSAKVTSNMGPMSPLQVGHFFRSQLAIKPTTLTIHNTGDIVPARGTTRSEQYARATYPNGAMNVVRVHWWVCKDEAWHQIDDEHLAWHSGDSEGNSTSLSMEIVGPEGEENGAKLAAIILHKYGWGVERLRTHNYWIGLPDRIVAGAYKNCPYYILPHWDAFKQKVQKHLDSLAGKPEPQPQPQGEIHRVQVGAFTNELYANAMADKARLLGFDPWVFTEKGVIRVQIGAFTDIENAKRMRDRLESLSFNTWIVERNLPAPSAPKESPTPTIRVGDRVRVRAGAKTWTGQTLAGFVFKTVYTVMEINGDRVVIGVNNVVIAAVRSGDLTRV